MNSKPSNEAEALRSDIEMTRRRMDDTMNALGERLHGRHLLDEIIGFFRGSENDRGSGTHVREKIGESAGSAANAVINTVKKNPVPIFLLTAGAAWLTYSAIKQKRDEFVEEPEIADDDPYDPASHVDRPLEYPGETTGSKFQQMKDTVAAKTAAAQEQLREKWSDVSDKSREIYGQTRDRVVDTIEQHPIQVGLGCLVVGALIGLALPTPDPVHRLAGSTVDRLKQRTRDAGRDVVEKGKRVAQAASSAAKREAEAQGLTLEQLRARFQDSATAPASPSDLAAGPATSAPRADNSRPSVIPADPSGAGAEPGP